MATVRFCGTAITCEQGEILRDLLLDAGETPHNGAANSLNCHGFGTCGTCAVEVEGETNDRTSMEQWRLDFPPHSPTARLRLACQTRVEGDLLVDKHEGFWGQHTPETEHE